MPNKTYNINNNIWTYGDTINNSASIFNTKLGPCPLCGSTTFNYGGGWRCLRHYCSYSSNNPVGNLGPKPSWWNTTINIGIDGNQFTAYNDDFLDLQQSNCGFGNTPNDAVNDLLSQN